VKRESAVQEEVQFKKESKTQKTHITVEGFDKLLYRRDSSIIDKNGEEDGRFSEGQSISLAYQTRGLKEALLVARPRWPKDQSHYQRCGRCPTQCLEGRNC
jgi:hypothetical protein